MGQPLEAYSALQTLYGQSDQVKGDARFENLFLTKTKDGSLSFEKRGLGISVWFKRKVLPLISRVFGGKPAKEYDFAANISTFHDLILKAVSEVQAASKGDEGVQTIEKMIQIYNGLLITTSQRLQRYLANHGVIAQYQPISAEQVLQKAVDATPQDRPVMKKIQEIFPRLFPISQLEPSRLSLAIKLSVPGSSERTPVLKVYQELSDRVKEIRDAHPSQAILESREFTDAESLAPGNPASQAPLKEVPSQTMVDYVQQAITSLEGVKKKVFDEKQEELKQLHTKFKQLVEEIGRCNTEAKGVHFGKSLKVSSVDWTAPTVLLDLDQAVAEGKKLVMEQRELIATFRGELKSFTKLQADLAARIQELERYKERGLTVGLVATQWINELQKQEKLLTEKGYEMQQSVQDILSQHPIDALRVAVEEELTRRQTSIEETVRPFLKAQSFVDSIASILAKITRPSEKQITTQANQWHQQAKLYAYTGRALARYKCLRSQAEEKGIGDLPQVDTISAEILVPKWHSNPTNITRDDDKKVFDSFQALEKANTRMQAQLETIPDLNESLKRALEVVHGFDRFVQVQERINVLVPIIYDDIWEQHAAEFHDRYAGISRFFTASVEKMDETFETLGSSEQILQEVEKNCKEAEKSVPEFFLGAGLWNFWIKAKTGKTLDDANTSLLDQFLDMGVEARAHFIATAMMTGTV